MDDSDLPSSVAMASIARDIGRALIERDEVGRGIPLTLSGGLAGLATLYANLTSIDDDAETFRREARRCLREFEVRLPQLTTTKCGMFNGLAGAAWSIRYAAERLGEAAFLEQDQTELLEVIDSYLAIEEDVEYDLIGGVVGIGMFALTLAESSWRERFVERILQRLELSAVPISDGIAWATPAYRKAKPADPSYVQTPEFNVGIAHGVPGVINFLAHCLMRGTCERQSRRMLIPATKWLCEQILPSTSESSFGYVAGSNAPARAAWCYGDPGVALALTNASLALRSSAINAIALSVVRRAAARNVTNSGILDTGYCHGTAGLAHVFRMLFERTGVEQAKHAYQYWLSHTVRLRQPGQGICGYRQWVVEPHHSLFADFDYLTGVIGIALVLVDEVTNPSDWAYPLVGAREWPNKSASIQHTG